MITLSVDFEVTTDTEIRDLVVEALRDRAAKADGLYDDLASRDRSMAEAFGLHFAANRLRVARELARMAGLENLVPTRWRDGSSFISPYSRRRK